MNKLVELYRGWALVSLLVYSLGQLSAYLMWLQWLPSFRQSYAYAGLLLVLLIVRVPTFFSQPTRKPAMLGWILLLIIVFVQVVSYSDIARHGGTEEFLQTIAFTAILSPLMWAIGEALGGVWHTPFWSRQIRIVSWVAFLGTITAILVAVAQGYIRYGTPMFHFISYENGVRDFYNYLALADTLAVLGILTMFLEKRIQVRGAVFLVTTVFLIFAYSRASLFFFVIVGFFGLWRDVRRRGFVALFASITLLVIGIIAAVVFLERRTEEALFTRMSALLISPSQDESFVGRINALTEGLTSLEEHWLFGEFMAEWYETGETGTYIHNWLSFWLCYGLFPFLLFSVLAFVCSRIAFLGPRTADALKYLLLFALLSICLAKAYVWPFIWLALGLTAAYERKAENDEDSLPPPLQYWDQQRSSQEG